MNLKEASCVLGYGHAGEISRHERLSSLPSLRTALRYEALYRVPIQKLFPQLFDEESEYVQEHLAAFLEECRNSSAKGRVGAMIARKLKWAWERSNQGQGSLFELP